MSLPEEFSLQASERLQLLKQRAQAVLSRNAATPSTGMSEHLQLERLLEDLRIYQVELELQNEELRTTQLEAELARKRYQTLFSQMPLAAVVVDNKGVVDDSNERADTLLGLRKRHGSLDVRLWQQLNQPDRARLHMALRDLLPGQTLLLPQLTLGESSTQSQVYDAHLIALSINYKLDLRVLILLVDRTSELARQQDQRFYSLLLDSSDAFIYAFDKHGNTLLANQALLNFVGRSKDEVMGKKRETYLPLRDAMLHLDADLKVLKSGQTITIEEQVHLPAPHTTLDFLTRKFPLCDRLGAVYGVGGISTDITALKDQQRQTLLSETVFLNTQDSIIITDAQTRIVRVNPAFERQTGFSAATVMGRKTSILKSGRQDATFYAALWDSLNTQGQWAGEFNNRRSDGTYYTVRSSINAVRDTDGTLLHYIGVQTDVTQLHMAQLALAHQAAYDNLTGLPNRSLFNDRISQLIIASQRQQKNFAVLFIDLDRFKEVNDTRGHHTGDLLLCEVAKRLHAGVRSQDTVARMGGDEFVVLLPDTDRQGAQAVGANLLERLRAPLQIEQMQPYRLMASLGLALFPDDGGSADVLLRSSDMAMYGAKNAGRNQMLCYTAALGASNDEAFAIQTELTQAIALQQLRVYFQPKVLLASGLLCGAEVLVRWERPGYGLTMPGVFIGIAEKSGLLIELDHWVMQAALRQLGQWVRAGLWASPMRLAVNQNVLDLQQVEMVPQLQSMLLAQGVTPDLLELEITEDALVQHTPELLARLQSLREMGISVAIDDFGTGYSSLSYLRQLPISVIKIDQSFVASMLANNTDAVLVRTIIDMAHSMGHALVAEGVEASEQCQRLHQDGVEMGQGYLFGRPVCAEEFAARWLQCDCSQNA
jgi:diguanylate cyclase (GGDEF)-like protein/PAS domain S-box-containing protein